MTSNNSTKVYLGIDWGEKRIGLALGDGETRIATPFKVVGSVDEVLRAVKEEDVGIVVVGMPLKMKDIKIKMQKEFLELLDKLKEKLNVPIKTVDERLSSKAADALAGGKRTKAQRDAVAAMLILQGYLDKYNSNASN